MRVVFDTNVVLDVLLAREPHVEAAARLAAMVRHGRIEGLLCATTLTTIAYVAGRVVGGAQAQVLLRELLAIFGVAGVDGVILQRALSVGFTDFEDAVVHEAAVMHGADCIVTRDASGFRQATIPIYAPVELLRALLSTDP